MADEVGSLSVVVPRRVPRRRHSLGRSTLSSYRDGGGRGRVYVPLTVTVVMEPKDYFKSHSYLPMASFAGFVILLNYFFYLGIYIWTQ